MTSWSQLVHSPACVSSHLSLVFSLLIREFQPWDILKAGRAYVFEASTSSQPTDTRRA